MFVCSIICYFVLSFWRLVSETIVHSFYWSCFYNIHFCLHYVLFIHFVIILFICPYHLLFVCQLSKNTYKQSDSCLFTHFTFDTLPSAESFNPHLPLRYLSTTLNGKNHSWIEEPPSPWLKLLQIYIKYSNRLPDYKLTVTQLLQWRLCFQSHSMGYPGGLTLHVELPPPTMVYDDCSTARVWFRKRGAMHHIIT